MTSYEFQHDLLKKQIAIIISTLGMNEHYVSFQYLHSILVHMMTTNDSIESYREAINNIKSDNNISSRTVSHGLNKILSMCNNTSLTSRPQYNLNHQSTYNKIKLIKSYTTDMLNEKNWAF